MKKKIFLIALAACLITLSVAGSSLAYFTDIASESNVFTAGNVKITLDYNTDPTRLYPGETYTKTATITNSGTENAYVGIIIDVRTEGLDLATVQNIFTVPGNDTVRYIVTDTGYAIYAVVDSAVTTDTNDNANVATLAIKMDMPTTWGNEEMNIFNSLTVEVTAYAVQTVGFENDGAATALTAAFDVWADGYNTTTQAEQVDPEG